MHIKTMSQELLDRVDAWWRAANYLSVGQIYLRDNPLLQQPLKIEHIKSRLLGHWGTTPGLNFIYAHLNRVIKTYDINILNITGPGHGGPGIVANAYLDGTYSEFYPEVSEDLDGMLRLFKQFSHPGGISSHVGAEVPGSIHEGGELGYSLSHAYGAAFDNPDLLVACVIGDGEAETGALATSWHSNKFLNPIHDGAVLPILHLNGYKIASPTLLARIPHEELAALFRGYGYTPYFVEGENPKAMHAQMAETLDTVIAEIHRIQTEARSQGFKTRPRWPMIILRSPKGWTGPKIVDHQMVEGGFRSHQVPLDHLGEGDHLALLEEWLLSYRPQELFDANGKLFAEFAALAPRGDKRMSANPHANGGLLLRDLTMPDFHQYAVALASPGACKKEATRIQGEFIRDLIQLNPHNFRVFSPDETQSNRWSAVFDVTTRAFTGTLIASDEKISADGRVMEMLSEHQCEGWLEGYLLTGRHGFFSCYEAFIHIINSLFNQHAKWLKIANHIPWRQPIASLNYLLSSHVWQQDHNGFSHQDPGFLDHVINKKAEIVRVYLPPDANTLLCVTDHCLRSRNYVNVIVAGKQAEAQWLTIGEAEQHCAAGIGRWFWASSDNNSQPDIVMACCGDVPTLETLAAVKIMRSRFPDIKVRVINVVDLMKLQTDKLHPHGLSDDEFDRLFPEEVPVIFAFHGYPSLVHRLIYSRKNQHNFHVHGYKEEGSTTTPFDMVVRNELDRFRIFLNAVGRIDQLRPDLPSTQRWVDDQLTRHQSYIRQHGEDLPEISQWQWEDHT